MLERAVPVILSLILSGILISSCSSRDAGNPVTVGNPSTPQLSNLTTDSQNGRYLWGYWDGYWNPENETVELIPRRDISMHMNTATWLEFGPCTDCLAVTSITPNPSGAKNVDLKITHPFNNAKFTGFDVRGIAMFDPGHFFPEHTLYVPDKDVGNGELANADGWTYLYNGGTAMSGYTKGKFASETPPTANINGFKRFISDDFSNERHAFYAGGSKTVTFEIFFPTVEFRFGYAVDANWAQPLVEPVNDIVNDFPPEASSPEPWRIVVSKENESGLTNHGGSMDLVVEVHDYQGWTSFYDPVVECPALFDGEIPGLFFYDGPDFWRFRATIENDKLAAPGVYPALVTVTDKDNDMAPPAMWLKSYYLVDIEVNSADGFAGRWGGSEPAYGYDLDTDSDGNIYVTGSFSGDTSTLIDLDPGPDQVWAISNGFSDCYIIKFSPDGNYIWSRTWGGTSQDQSLSIDVSENKLVVGGFFKDVVDFDPDAGEFNRASNGYRDGFVSCFDLDGAFLWAETFGSDTGDDETLDVVIDKNGYTYSVGDYTGTCDFDPTSGVDEHTTGIWNPAGFYTKFSIGGAWTFTKSWGEGDAFYTTKAEAIALDNNQDAWITGFYRENVDFDPGPDVEFKTSNGEEDVFLLNLSDNGVFLRLKTWGGPESDLGKDVMLVDNSMYVTGAFRGTIDFDPDPAYEHFLESWGDYDAFLWWSNGPFVYGNTHSWGGAGSDLGFSLAQTESHIYVAGEFMDLCDFDPTTSIDSLESNGLTDAYVVKYTQDLTYEWSNAWGGVGQDRGYGVVADSSNNSVVTGSFKDTVDFDPTAGVYNLTAVGSSDAYFNRILADGTW